MGVDEIGGDALMACYQATIDTALAGMRLDAALRRTFPELPSWSLRDAFVHRDVKLNGKRAKPEVRVAGGGVAQGYVVGKKTGVGVGF
mgnify:CR=1 FL=1